MGLTYCPVSFSAFACSENELFFFVLLTDFCFFLCRRSCFVGGQEAVLALWHLQTGKRRFLPRLGAPLAHVVVSSDDTVYAVALMDNCVKLVDATTLDLLSVVKGIRTGEFLMCTPPARQQIFLLGSIAMCWFGVSFTLVVLPPLLDAAQAPARTLSNNVTLHPDTGALVMPSTTGAIQMYDVLRDTCLRDVQVS